MENNDAIGTNGQSVGQHRRHAYAEMRRAVARTVDRGTDLAKTVETRLKTRPPLAAGIGLAAAGLALGAGALFVWRPWRRRGLGYAIERLVDRTFEAALRRLKTTI
jgi:GNAT superfamily N-acetyltransferase